MFGRVLAAVAVAVAASRASFARLNRSFSVIQEGLTGEVAAAAYSKEGGKSLQRRKTSLSTLSQSRKDNSRRR
jgi:hypothetical protein